MLRLITFGGLALRDEGQPHTGAASQRRRLALIALVAAAGDRGISRDKLLGYLWTESESEAARHALHQALSGLRRSLDADDLFQGTATLQLNPARMTSDVHEFEAALEARACERAVALYAGPFLDGFFLDGVPEFERWVDGMRDRLARAYAGCLEELANAATARNDHAAAAQWWRRLATAEPLNTRPATGLIASLVAVGDPAGALQFACLHEALVREELDAAPDPAITEWITRLRSGRPVIPVTPPAGTSATRADPAPAARPDDARAATPPRMEGSIQQQRIESALAGRYALEQQIADGTVVSTYLGRDLRAGRAVDINVLNSRVAVLANIEHVVRALGRAASLSDSHILSPDEVGAVEGIVFYVTPHVEGTWLRERLAADGQLTIAEAIRIAHDMAAALAHAHGRDVRHGDLRPKHVLATREGAMVASFGLVEALSARTDSTAVIVGAPSYLSPEQLSGEGRADERSDLYSLGCILFEMLAGEVPFAGARHFLVSRKLTQAPPSIRGLRSTVPEEIERALQRCLARVPADRYRSAEELRADLASVGAVL